MPNPAAAAVHDDLPTSKIPRGRSFWSLVVTQFQGAFSDNALKNLVLFLLIGAGLPQAGRKHLEFLILVLFALPIILFSMAGGYFADRYSKRTVTIGVKVFEILVMSFALGGFALGSLPMQLAAVFLMGVHSAIFGPSKYGLLPELLPEKQLSSGNGIFQMGTFLAIILGTVAGAVSAGLPRSRQVWPGAILVGLAIFGFFTSMGIRRVPPADPTRKFRVNFLSDLFFQIGRIRQDRVLSLAVVGSMYFWFLVALLQPLIFDYGVDVLGKGERQVATLLVLTALGIGLGSFAAGHLSGSKIEYGLIPLGALGMTSLGAVLSFPGLTFAAVAGDLTVLGFFSAFFIVPINALIQYRPKEEEKGRVIAAAGLLSFVGVFLSAGVYFLLTAAFKLSPPASFLLIAVVTVAGTGYALYLLPDALLRLLVWLATHSLYRIRVVGRDNIPEKGGALFVSNHLSLVDQFLLMASTDRFIRFLMLKEIYEHPAVKPFAKVMRAIPISSELRPRDMIHSLRQAREAIEAGDVVCIFAEGQMTRIGQLLPFRRGFERIMKDVEAPIIPVNLAGVWGSIFSFKKGRFLWKLPRRIPYRVTVSFGAPMPSSATHTEVRQAVQELDAEAYRHNREQIRPLHHAFVRTAHRHPFRLAMADGQVPRLRFGTALIRTIFLARRLRPEWEGQPMVGILLPPSVPGALVNLAALLLGKIPVNLNYTVSENTLSSCAAQCGIETVLTSRAFLDRVHVAVPARTILLEDVAARPRFLESLLALLFAWALPASLLERLLSGSRKSSLDDLATVIFSSGSTGDPKGVMLTHYNIASNIRQIEQVFALRATDSLLGILPFFHSFGFTVTLCLPVVLGIGVIYHPNPLDAKAIGALVRQYGVTILLTTPTFLQAYTRRCEPKYFGSLQFVLASAEKLPERIAQAFEDRFGLRPLEGYGCTECAPVLTLNTRDFRATGYRQVGAKRGSIGHPLPGVGIRIVNPETGEPLRTGEPGLLLVRGPNVMKGYLGQPEKTAEVLRNGWYTTGDIAAVDEDGFLVITDRLSRFSKIGGEMVPHIKVEEKLGELVEVAEQAFVVTSVPDPRKGERLVVLHTLAEDQLKECLEKLPQTGLPNLWIPRPNQFFRIEALPYLGSGKLDLRRAREMAKQFSSDASSAETSAS